MRPSSLLIIGLAALVLSACNFTLAEDVPPPPDYVAPTPMPTLGALVPASAPDPQNGAAIFQERCAPCHGATGLGDGPQSMQLPVTVPGLALPEVGRAASPASWFKVVTQGNLDRFMPPFVGALTDSERWDVVAYILTLHTTSSEVARGADLIEADCPTCAEVVADQTKLSNLSEDDLVRILREGDADIPAFGASYSDTDARAAAAQLRLLSFAASSESVAAPATVAPPTQLAGTPLAEGTLSAEAPTAQTGIGTVSGMVETGAPGHVSGLAITLRGYDHSADQAAGPQEVLTLAGTVAPDGSYRFEDVAMPENRIFLAEVEYAGIQYRSEFETSPAGSTSVSIPPLAVYEPSTDVSLLKIDQVHVYTDFATAGTVQVLEIFAFSNSSDKAVIISSDGVSIPFIQLPSGALNQGYEAGQDSEQFVAADKGLAVVPSEKPYSIIAFFNLPYEKSLDFQQPLAIDSPSILLLVPEGIKVKGDQWVSRGTQVFQENTYQMWAAQDLKAGSTLSFAVSGRPKATSATGLDAHQGWLIGGGALGLALILGGVYLFLRDRQRESVSSENAEFESSEEILDAILALDDLHRAGQISDAAHAARRAELKQKLKDLS